MFLKNVFVLLLMLHFCFLKFFLLKHKRTKLQIGCMGKLRLTQFSICTIITVT